MLLVSLHRLLVEFGGIGIVLVIVWYGTLVVLVVLLNGIMGMDMVNSRFIINLDNFIINNYWISIPYGEWCIQLSNT